MTLRHLLSLLGLLAAASPLVAQPVVHAPRILAGDIATATRYEPQPFDVLLYDAALDLTAAPAPTMSGSCTATLVWKESGTPPYRFHLAALTVDSVVIDGTPVAVVKMDSTDPTRVHYSVTPPTTVQAGDTARVRIVYHGTMTAEPGPNRFGGVFSSSTILYAIGVGFNNSYVSTTRHWLPCYDHPSDKAAFHGSFRVKRERVVASNGLVTATDDSDSTRTFHWRTDLPTATYLLTFAVDRYTTIARAGTPPSVIYTLPNDSTQTARSFSLLPMMITGFERRFGAYPFEKVGYVNTPIGAMEHQTMISYPTALARTGDSINSVGAHELVHQWFGDLVSPLDFRHAWLTESFATHGESEWEEELGGFEAYLTAQEAKAESYFGSAASEGIFPIHDFPRSRPSSNYPRTIYEKGAVVVGMLRYELGDSLFYRALRDYLTTYAYGTATTDDMQQVMEEHAGRPLDWFFDQWIRERGWPTFGIGLAREPAGGGMSTVTAQIRQTSNGGILFGNVPVEITFHDNDTVVATRVVRASDSLTLVTLDSIPDYDRVTINRGPSLRALFTVASLSSVERREMRLPVTMTVTPNPVRRGLPLRVRIETGRDGQFPVGYTLVDVTGRAHAAGSVEMSGDFVLRTDTLPAGSYILRLRSRRGSLSTPVTIAP